MTKTLTLDDDVLAKLEREARREGKSLEEVVNYYLRLGLSAREQEKSRRRITAPARSMGLRDGLSLTSAARLIDELEGPLHR